MIAEDKEVTITVKSHKDKDKPGEFGSQTQRQATVNNLQSDPQKL